MKRESLAQGARRAMKGGVTKRAQVRRETEPSKASLRDIPEVDFATAKVRRNVYASRIAKEGITLQVGKGRPKRLQEVGGTHPRSVRFPDFVWEEIEKQAKQRGLTVHAVLREAVLEWLKHAA